MKPAALTPADLGLPPKFEEYYPGQLEVALSIAGSDRRFSLLDAPTGAGKSPICVTISKLLDARTLVLVGTKGLQNQYMHDFATMGMTDIRGQNNYRCVALDRGEILEDYGNAGSSCELGPCKVGVHCDYRRGGGCQYYDSIARAARSRIVVSNYAFWLSLARMSDPLAIGKFDLIVLDEGHTAHNWLTEFCAVDLRRDDVKELIDRDLPSIEEGIDVWATWARESSIVAAARYATVKEEIAMALGRKQRTSLTHQLIRLQRLGLDCDELSKAHSWHSSENTAVDVRMPGMTVDWVGQDTKHGVKFSPVWGHPYAERYLFRAIPKVVLSSATLSPVVARQLGITDDVMTKHNVKSRFSPKRRPFIYIPTTRVDHRMVEGQRRIWINRIDSIISSRIDRKGIIHAVSYARAQEIVQRSKFRQFMMIHTSQTAREVIAKFKEADAPAILVSPSVVEGFDFPMDECRWQIIAKIPFPDGRDPVYRARKKSDPDYGNYLASLAITQMVGRSTRAVDDASECFVIDDHWSWLRRRVPFARWFRDSWQTSHTVPEPISL